jgi:hypothetical protein
MSKKFSLNMEDVKAQAKSAFIFLAPSILAFLVALSPAVQSLKPNTTQEIFAIIAIKWALDQATGIVRRWVDGPKK